MRTLAILAALMFGGSVLATPASATPPVANKTQLVGKKHNKKAKKHAAQKHSAKKGAAKKGAHKKHHKKAGA